MPDETGEPKQRYKVGRVLAAYDLEGLHAELPDLWLGADGDALSLRDLADRLNVAVLRQAMERAGADPLEGEAENAYRLLTDDGVSVGVRTQQRNRLERAGVDIDDLEDDFVTHQAVYTYLTQALEVSKADTDETDPLEKHEQRIQRLRSRTDAVTENSLDELTESEELTLGEYSLVIDLQVYCRDCDSQYDITTLFETGGCDCA